MTEVNIFKAHERFEQRGNPGVEVEWHLFKYNNQVAYFDKQGTLTWTKLNGFSSQNDVKTPYDLVPMLPPPVMVPWDCPDDVPDPCWIRLKASVGLDVQPVMILGFSSEELPLSIVEDEDYSLDIVEVGYLLLFHNYEWSSNRKAKYGWQVCGKLKDAQK